LQQQDANELLPQDFASDIKRKRKGSHQASLAVPIMLGCNRQKYGYSPASVKVCSSVAAGAIMHESNMPSSVTFSPDVAMWW
jgi:hypothetical protein